MGFVAPGKRHQRSVVEVIRVTKISKRFKLYRKPSDRILESLVRRPRHSVHQALREVSFSVEDGETLGIIGRNGAGKSTLLKILMGVLLPEKGEIRIDGKVTGLLELGTGFDQALSGVANIERNGVILGMSRKEIARRRDAIIEFSELGSYIHEPLRTYSSGMSMRLAFSIAIHADPACFLVDEALSVGDAHFQQKCIRRIQDFRKGGGSLIFVSHDLNAVKVLCDRVLVLDAGRVLMSGSPEKAVNRYNQLIAQLEKEETTGLADEALADGYGTLDVEVLSVALKGEESGTEILSAGEDANVYLRIRANKEIEDLTVGILIRDRFGQDVFGTNSHLMNHPLSIRAGQLLYVRLRFRMNLGPNKYTLTVALHSRENHLERCYHWCDNLIRFEVAGVRGPLFSGIARLEPEIHSELLSG
jgi:lipopolysaccharide transport system ATP-binding protein